MATVSVLPNYSVVIATIDRPGSLDIVLACLAAQSHGPQQVIVADASALDDTRRLVEHWASRLPVLYLPCAVRSAAVQRNTAAAHAKAPLLAFMDDDVDFPPELLETLCTAFAGDFGRTIAGVSGREANMTHPRPHGLLRAYYRLQAGFDDPNYGARLFGPAINCVPCYAEDQRDLVPADWLPSTCVVYRREYFEREHFPDFDEYSAMEDVHA